MTLSWAIYALFASLALGWAATATESVLRLYGRQARFAWVGAMAASVLLSALALVTPGLPALLGSGSEAARAPLWAVPAIPELMGSVQVAAESGRPLVRRVETGFHVAWVLGSGWLLLHLIASVRSVHRRRAGWRPLDTGRGTVYRDEELGPAAVGVVSPAVVLPGWVLELDETERRMVLLHEREHARVRDPALVAAAWGLVVLCPWNLLLWWQLRRLRQAVELDCDVRVVRRTGDRRTYGSALLEAARKSARGAVPVVAGGESFVGERIHRLLDGTPPFRPLHAVSGVSAIVCALVLAATLPSPRAVSAWSGQALVDRAPEGARPIPREVVPVTSPAEVRGVLAGLHADRCEGGDAVGVPVHARGDGVAADPVVARRGGAPVVGRAAPQLARRTDVEPRGDVAAGSSVSEVQPLRVSPD